MPTLQDKLVAKLADRIETRDNETSLYVNGEPTYSSTLPGELSSQQRAAAMLKEAKNGTLPNSDKDLVQDAALAVIPREKLVGHIADKLAERDREVGISDGNMLTNIPLATDTEYRERAGEVLDEFRRGDKSEVALVRDAAFSAARDVQRQSELVQGITIPGKLTGNSPAGSALPERLQDMNPNTGTPAAAKGTAQPDLP